MADLNMALEWVNLFNTHETHIHSQMAETNAEIEELVETMGRLEDFLVLVRKRTESSKRLDLATAEEQEMIDDLRKRVGISHLFPHGKYQWKEEEVAHLADSIGQTIEGSLQRKLNMKSEDVMFAQHDLTTAMELFNKGVENSRRLIDRINANIQRR